MPGRAPAPCWRNASPISSGSDPPGSGNTCAGPSPILIGENKAKYADPTMSNHAHPAPDRLLSPDCSQVSREVFNSGAVYQAEQRRIFERNWLYLAHESQLRQPGDFASAYMGEVPVIVAMGSDGKIAASVNSCPHRGLRVCRADRGNAIDTSRACTTSRSCRRRRSTTISPPRRRAGNSLPCSVSQHCCETPRSWAGLAAPGFRVQETRHTGTDECGRRIQARRDAPQRDVTLARMFSFALILRIARPVCVEAWLRYPPRTSHPGYDPDDTYENQIGRHDIIQQARHYEYQHAGDQRDPGREHHHINCHHCCSSRAVGLYHHNRTILRLALRTPIRRLRPVA